MTTDAVYITRSNAEALIPTEISNEIIKATPGASAALSLMKRLPNMSAKQRTLPVMSALPSAYFINGDTGSKKTTKTEWEKLTITAEELAVIIPIPEAVLDDAQYDIWEEIKPQITEAFGAAIDDAIFFGTNKPSSWASAIVPTAITKGNTIEIGTNDDIAGDIIGENGVMALVEASGYKVSGFYADGKFESKLRNLRDSNNQLLYIPSLTSDCPTSLLGRPVIYDELGVFDDDYALLIAGDFNKAVYSIRQDLTYKVLDQAVIQNTDGSIAYNLAQQDMVALRVVMRLGFQVATPANRKGGSDRYPFALIVPATETESEGESASQGEANGGT